jgi:phage terminase large subunit-like protein
MNWSTALPDWERRIVAGESMVPCRPLFQDQADQALDTFRDLKIVDAAGQPTFGASGGQWVIDFVAAIFGAYDPEAGSRLINEFFLCDREEERQVDDRRGHHAHRAHTELARTRTS